MAPNYIPCLKNQTDMGETTEITVPGLLAPKQTDGGNRLFPIFLKLEKFVVLIVGGGLVGLEKLSAILRNSPDTAVTLIGENILSEIRPDGSGRCTIGHCGYRQSANQPPDQGPLLGTRYFDQCSRHAGTLRFLPVVDR